MSMEILEHLPSRIRPSGKRASWALFKCSFCEQIIERTLSSKNYKSCGCVRHVHPGCKSRFKTGATIDDSGYKLIYKPDHHRAHTNGYVSEHIFIAELATGIKLNSKHQVHHIDGNKLNNAKNNLVICENNAYHQLLHLRTRAYKSTDNPNLLRCSGCNKYMNIEEFNDYRPNTVRLKSCYCKTCSNKRLRDNYPKYKDRIKIYQEENKDKIKDRKTRHYALKTSLETPEEYARKREKNKIAVMRYLLKKKEAEHA